MQAINNSERVNAEIIEPEQAEIIESCIFFVFCFDAFFFGI